MKVYNNILETIGNTPIIKLSNLYDNQNVEIYGKLESLNPAGSIKDRICLKINLAFTLLELLKEKVVFFQQ